MSSEPRGRGGRASRGARSRGAVVAAALVVIALGLTRAPPPAVAKEGDKALIDKVDVRPSRLYGMARVRALISAFELLGARIPDSGAPVLTVKLGGAKVSFVTGLSRTAEVELVVVLVVATTDAYLSVLDPIRDKLKEHLFAPLGTLGPRVRLAVIGYDSVTRPAKSLGSVATAQADLDQLGPEDVTSEVALARAVDEAIAMASRAKPKQVGAMVRPVVVIVSDGDGIPVEEDARAEITALGVKADKAGVRIHALAYSPTDQKRSLLTLGELSKRSKGTFRWIRNLEGWAPALDQLADQLANQYVVTFLAPLENESGESGIKGKKLAVTIRNGDKEIDAVPVPLKAPKCGKIECEGDAYCVRDQCVVRRTDDGGGGALQWILIIVGSLVGLGAVLFVGATVIARRGPKPPPIARPVPIGATGAMAAAPAVQAAPMAPPGGPVLIVMSGPEAGRQIPLHHGFTLGKSPGSHLGLGHDSTASTNHAQITFDGAAWTLTDLGSTNGTFANGNRVTSVTLYPGMMVRVGSTDVRFWQA